MKICPNCRQTYTDESLNFCLNDGSILNSFKSEEGGEATVLMGQSPLTQQNQTVVQTNPTFPANNQTVVQPVNTHQNSVQTQPAINRPPIKRSKTWLWILAIFTVLAVIGGIGFIGLVALVANIDDNDNTVVSNNNRSSSSPSPSAPFDSVQYDDFSKWRIDSNSFGNTEYNNGEYVMSSKQTGFFYVLVTAGKTFTTSNAATKIVARNVTGKETKLGYGLLIHSDANVALSKDYGFLIDAAKQSYRVVQHTSSKESELVGWTKFPAVRSGTQTNEIEVKDQNGKMSFFINGQFATSINDSVKFKDGVFGLYVSDAVPIAFSKLQLSK